MGRVGVRALASVAAFGMICVLGAGGANGITPAPGTPAYKRLANKICHCKIPERYRFRIAGTTNFWIVTGGGTETWSMRGVLRRHYRRVPWTRSSYWQARGTVTVSFSDVGYYDSRCTNPESAVFDAPAQTTKLVRNGIDVQFDFRFSERKYAVDTDSSFDPIYRPDPAHLVHGTVHCDDGPTFPANAVHSPAAFGAHGRPLRVVKGHSEYTVHGGNHDGDHVRAHWKLRAIR
jgi:hypothetical protein